MTILICIDPGVKTGFAILREGKLSEVGSGKAITVEVYILGMHMKLREELKIYIEDARKRTWFGSKGREVAQGVGSIKRDCKRWEDFCEYHCIEYELIHPKNNKTKLKSDEFKRLTGFEIRTNEHGRDAAMLVFGR